MDKAKIERINVLARKSRAEGLTESEKKEHAELREEYLEGIRKNFRAQLDNIKIVD